MNPTPSPTSSAKPPGWNPIVIVIVGIFCSIFLLFSYYKILKRNWCSSRGARFSRSSRFQRHFPNELDSPDPEDPSSSLQFDQSHRLDSFIMHSIPITMFEKKKGEEEEELEKGDCAVCLGEFEDGDWVKNLPNCSHVFHVACIDTWFQIHSSCPLCRSCVYDGSMDDGHLVSMRTLVESLRNRDLSEEGSRRNEALRSQNLQND